MKYFVLSLVASFLFIGTASAQNEGGFGLKGGLNYDANGKFYESAVSAAEKPDRNLGYHFGLFYQTGGTIYLKPELVYTATKSDYNSGKFKMQKIDAPVLVGVRLIKFLNVFAGPSFQYILDSEFDGITIDEVKNDFTVGLNFGVGFSLNKIGIDLRYERGFSKNEGTFATNNGLNVGRIDMRPDQLILSISLAL
ncbi:PorT family protein [Bizionia argentinensis JUB59]|uniref:PorT family protein n=1 Tax=Bizionia argentinensis JUB59 TaxID=1046627 RepID=G2EGI5_9FLAO|nr:outer membrane beta-barrel protein [Bizionia argentinensis]EGV42447.1 PorT family protein [Bizionia argentinensis JUB59]